MSNVGLPVVVQGSEKMLTNGFLTDNGIVEIKQEVVDLDTLEERETPGLVAPPPDVKMPSVVPDFSGAASCGCAVEELLSEQYSDRIFTRTLEFIRKGRPKPCVVAKPENVSSRLFRDFFYEKNDWLTGCIALNKLYCWPCLIFDKVEGMWNRAGYDDVSNLYKAFKRHEISQNHIVASMQLVAFVLNHCDRIKSYDEELNGLIRSNREAMVRIVETVCAAGFSSSNGLRTCHLLRLARRENCLLGTVPGLHLAVARALTVAFTDAVVADAQNSPFVSFFLDEVAGRLAAVIRYSDFKGELCDAFVGFFEETDLSKVVEHLRTKFSLKGRLVALLLGATTKIESVPDDPRVTILHSPAHRMSYVLSFAFQHIKECSSFFHVIRCFETWLSDSQVEEYIKSKLPNCNPAKWREHPVSVLSEQKEFLQDLVLIILEKPSSWQHSCYCASLALQHAFKDVEFTFLLRVFKELFPVADALLDMIMTNSPNMKLCSETVEDYLKVLNWKKEKFIEIWEDIQEIDLEGPRAKKHRHGGSSKLLTYYRTLYESIVDGVVSQVKLRFGSIMFLEFAELINMRNCDQTSICEKHIVMLRGKRDNFEISRLRNELIVAYAQVDFKGLQCDQLLKHLYDTGLGDPLKQVTLLARLILMLPYASKTQYETCTRLFSKIHKFAHKISSDPYLLQWASISLEYNFINKLAVSTSLIQDTIELFALEHPDIQLTPLEINTSKHSNHNKNPPRKGK